MGRQPRQGYRNGMGMVAPVTASEQDLRALLGIVSDNRDDLPAEGLPPSLLADLTGLIRCEGIAFHDFDSPRQETWFSQSVPVLDDVGRAGFGKYDLVHWQLYWDCQPCSFSDRAGDLRSVVKISDFYSARQWHSVGMYCDIYRRRGLEHDLMLTLPAAPGPAHGPSRTMRLYQLP